MQMMSDIKELQAGKTKLIEELQNEADKYIKLQTASEAEREKLLSQVTYENQAAIPCAVIMSSPPALTVHDWPAEIS